MQPFMLLEKDWSTTKLSVMRLANSPIKTYKQQTSLYEDIVHKTHMYRGQMSKMNDKELVDHHMFQNKCILRDKTNHKPGPTFHHVIKLAGQQHNGIVHRTAHSVVPYSNLEGLLDSNQ